LEDEGDEVRGDEDPVEEAGCEAGCFRGEVVYSVGRVSLLGIEYRDRG
jgi:hypothetical protein